MSVIAELQIPARDFELGRVLAMEGVSSIELEKLVPTGGTTVPLFWVYNSSRDRFVEKVQRHPAVNQATEVDVFEDRTLFMLDWDAHQDHVFRGIQEYEGQLLSAVGTPDTWKFELRFPDHEELSDFTTHCEDAQVEIELNRVYNPTSPGTGPWYGLTERQREALRLAVAEGYYDIPRRCTTKELAEELGISDQAVTERLRRAVAALVANTLAPGDSADRQD